MVRKENARRMAMRNRKETQEITRADLTTIRRLRNDFDQSVEYALETNMINFDKTEIGTLFHGFDYLHRKAQGDGE